MKLTWTIVSLSACLSILPACPAKHPEPAPRPAPGQAAAGKLELVSGVRVLTLRGTPVQRGAAHGRLLKAGVRAVVARYVKGLVVRALGGWSNALAVARAAEPEIPKDVKDELRALARAAGVSYEELLVLNAHVDAMASGCSSITAQAPATRGGEVLLARNLDWSVPPGMENLALLMIVHQPGRQPVASYTYPGFVGVLTALSGAGVAVSMNVSNSRDRARRCVPTPLLIRAALEKAKTAKDLLDTIAAGKRCSGFLITAADPKGGGRVLEMTAGRTAVREPRKGLLISTNHFRSPTMTALQGLYYANSKERLESLNHWLEPPRNEPIGAGELWKALRTSPVYSRATLMTVLAFPRALKLRLWERGMGHEQFREVSLADRLRGGTR